MKKNEHYHKVRVVLGEWEASLKENIYLKGEDFRHTLSLHFGDAFQALDEALIPIGESVAKTLAPMVQALYLEKTPCRLDCYDALGNATYQIAHHPLYEKIGNGIYGTGILSLLKTPGKLKEALARFYLTSHLGEAGHHCPIACSAGIIRVLQKTHTLPQEQTAALLAGFTKTNYEEAFTGAQFITEIQGGSDVGANATKAFVADDGQWRLRGEKWFCSNADANFMLVSARYDETLKGTKGVGLFLVPAKCPDDSVNHFKLRRLKEKIGTQCMASSEIDFNDALAYPVLPLAKSFYFLMEEVLQLSRLFNCASVLGMLSRAFQVAASFAHYRRAFGTSIENFPLIQWDLAAIKTDLAALNAGFWYTVKCQDACDVNAAPTKEEKLLLRTFTHLCKMMTAKLATQHIHRALMVLGGNGAIETFSPIPTLLKDSIVCENWEGTHHTLRMQVLRDINRYDVDELFLDALWALKAALPSCALVENWARDFEDFKKNVSAFKRESEGLQSLQIKALFKDMAHLYFGICLLRESKLFTQTPQQTAQGAHKYLLATHWFRRQNKKGGLEYDEADLRCMQNILHV